MVYGKSKLGGRDTRILHGNQFQVKKTTAWYGERLYATNSRKEKSNDTENPKK